MDLSAADLVGTSLQGAHLSSCNLKDAHLAGAYLAGADLRGADFSGAKLFRAHCGGADFRFADLSNADLSGSYLGGANFEGATMSGARLLGTNFFGANLSGADLHGTIMGRTILGNLDLGGVLGLETVSHSSPSTIGVDTCFRSRGPISGDFLRGTGIPEVFLNYLDSLGKDSSLTTVLVYCSAADDAFVQKLRDRLESDGIRCWTSPWKHDDSLRASVFRSEVLLYTKLVLILSESSVGSPWLGSLVTETFARDSNGDGLYAADRSSIIPVHLDDSLSRVNQDWANLLPSGGGIEFRDLETPAAIEAAFTALILEIRR